MRNVLAMVCGVFASAVNPASLRAFSIALLVMAASAVPSICMAQATAPDIGVDPLEYITMAGTKLGVVIGAALGLFAVVFAIRALLSWVKRARAA